MAPISPQALVLPRQPPRQVPLNRVMLQGSALMDLAPSIRELSGKQAAPVRRPGYALDLAYRRAFKRNKFELSAVGYGVNLGMHAHDYGGGIGVRRRFEVNPRLVIAPTFTAGGYWFDLNVGMAKKILARWWWHALLGGRLSMRGVMMYGAAGLYQQVNPRWGIQYTLGLHYYFLVDALDRSDHQIDLSKKGMTQATEENMALRERYDGRLFNPHISVGPVLSF